MGGIPGARVLRFDAVTEGPPGDTLEIMLRGSRMETLLAASSELKRRLRRMEGVYQVSCDHVRGKSELRVALKPEARHFGLDVERLARQLYGGFYGEEAVRLQRGKGRCQGEGALPPQRSEAGSATSETCSSRHRMGTAFPFSTVAEIHRAEGLSTITRKDGKRCLVVSAVLDESRIQTEEVLDGLEASFFSRLRQRYPGVEWMAQGMEETEDEAFGSLFVGISPCHGG